MKLQTIPIKNLTREQWLALRRKGIGGSDAAAIVGLNNYATPYTVWADKTGRLPEIEDNERMRQGRDFEDYVAGRWTEVTGRKVQRKNAILVNPQYPFALANIDRWVVGANEGLECKTTSVLNLKHYKNGDYPPRFYVQCVHYLAVTGADRWHLGILVLNEGFHHFVVERDEAEIAALMEAEQHFWQYVKEDTPPPVSGLPADSDALAAIYAGSNKDAPPVELFGRDAIITQYLQLDNETKALEQRKEECKQILMADLGESEKGLTGQYVVNWTEQSRKSFDAKRYAADNPNIDLSDYYKESRHRRFSIKQIEMGA